MEAHEIIAELDHFAELVSGIDVQQRERNLAREKCLLRQPHHHRRIFTDRIKHHRILEFGGHFANNLDALGFEQV